MELQESKRVPTHLCLDTHSLDVHLVNVSGETGSGNGRRIQTSPRICDSGVRSSQIAPLLRPDDFESTVRQFIALLLIGGNPIRVDNELRAQRQLDIHLRNAETKVRLSLFSGELISAALYVGDEEVAYKEKALAISAMLEIAKSISNSVMSVPAS